MAARLKKNKLKAEQETAQPTAAWFNKPKAEEETAQPTAARFKKPCSVFKAKRSIELKTFQQIFL